MVRGTIIIIAQKENTLGKTYKDNKYSYENQTKHKQPGKRNEKNIDKKKTRAATKKELSAYK